MSSKVKPIPDGMSAAIPHLVCAGAAKAIEFYQKAFGAIEKCRIMAPQERVMHAQIQIGSAVIMLVDEFPEWNCFGPNKSQGSSVTIHLYVNDVDTFFKRAIDAGATVKMPVEDMFWGDRYGVLVDPFGHAWSVATHMRDLSPEEMQQAADKMCSEMCNQ